MRTRKLPPKIKEILSIPKFEKNAPQSGKSFLCFNSVEEAYAKCFSVHILEFEILQITWKNRTKNIRLLVFSFSSIDVTFWGFFIFFFYVVCKISNFNMWTAKHLVHASCTELTLSSSFCLVFLQLYMTV